MLFQRLASAFFYAISSLMITFANKIVLTSYRFSSFQTLALGQLFVTIVAIKTAEKCNLIKIAKFDRKIVSKLLPLAVFYFGNLLFGLGGTKSLNLPMFTVLRRFAVLMTMYGEYFILKKKYPFYTQLSIYMMVVGAIIAVLNDLTFETYGYVFIMMNNFFTMANGIYTKKKLETMKIGEYDLLYFNSIFSIFPMIFLSFYSGEIAKLNDYDQWLSPGFWFFFLVSSLMGFILNYSAMLCTRFNSPLTTMVTGCLKNIFVTYMGMLIGGDYIFSYTNFIGLTISSVSSIFYSYMTFTSKSDSKSNKEKEEQESDGHQKKQS